MKTVLVCAAMLVSAPFAASAQTAPAASAPAAPVADASSASTVFNGDTPIETIAASAAGKAALNKEFPDVLTHPAYEQFKGMSLRALAPLSGGLITDEKIATFEADMAAATPASDAAGASTVLNGDTPIETIAASAAGKAALTKQFPDLLTHPAYEQFKGMSLRALAPLSGGLITDEEIAAFEADVKATAK